MLIQKIKKLTNSEAFDSFEWTGKDLNKYNLIYGWNGSGKTTLSRIFYSLENKKLALELGDIELVIKTNDTEIKNTDIETHTEKIKVFNEDFIRDNLQFQNAKAKKILIVGKENENVTDEIRDLQKQQVVEQIRLERATSEHAKIPELDTVLTDAGREVVNQFANTPLSGGKYSGRTYNRKEVQTILNSGKITKENVSSFIMARQEDIDKRREIIKSQKNKINFTPSTIPDFSDLFVNANSLLKVVVSVEIITELENDNELRKWIEQGYHIHSQRSLSVCQFCKNAIEPDYFLQLGKFFTKELERVRKEIEIIVHDLDKEEYKGYIGSVESVIFFPDLAAEYLSVKSLLEEKAVLVRSSINEILTRLKDKIENLHDKAIIFSTISYPAESVQAVNDASEKIKKIIERHNEQIDGVSTAAKDIEFHSIASKLTEQKYFEQKENVFNLDKEISTIKEALKKIDETVKTKRLSVLNASLAIGKINDALREFFGPSHIYIDPEPDGAEVGYLLKRRGKNAKNLSEGEKSVIALMYFLTKLEEDGFNLETSFVLIDDPVDSQDELFLFKTFGLIKRYLSKSGQLVILTHNFPFFNLVRDWFMHENYRLTAELFLIRCLKTEDTHEASVQAIPELLKKYKSEYQYLFYQLYSFVQRKHNIEEPLVPNIARKVLEYFAGFKWSCNVSEDFTYIVQNRYITDQNPMTRGIADFIIKFLHEYSHGQDFSRPITASTFEAESVAINVLNFIKLVDKDHYGKLKALCEA